MKSLIVLRLLRGEELELLSREYGAVAARLSQWRDDFLTAGEAAMKKRDGDESEEVKRLREKLGEVTTDSELLREKVGRLEQNRPLPRRRSKKSAGPSRPPPEKDMARPESVVFGQRPDLLFTRDAMRLGKTDLCVEGRSVTARMMRFRRRFA